jgi:hypothetical protein
MEFCISGDELRKALEEIERAESNGFMYCLAVFKFASAGINIDDNIAIYSDLIEKAHPTDGRFDWGRFQTISKRYKFVNKKLIPLIE